MKLLREVSQERIKNQTELDNLINYLDRNQACIPCYALRKQLGLRISSNPGELPTICWFQTGKSIMA